MRATCVVKRWSHHTTSGGYDRLAEALGARIIERKQVSGIAGRLARRIWWRHTSTREYLIDYQFGDLLAEFQAIFHGLANPPDVLHVLYGDEQLHELLTWKSLVRCPLIATFHVPPGIVAKRFEKFHKGLINRVDAAVVVSTGQIQAMQRWIEPRKIVYIPHGVDTGRFRPGGRSNFEHRKMRTLIVGEHMRDWAVMHRVIDEINKRGLNVEFHAVINERDVPRFTGCENFVHHSKVAEAKLIDLYRSADVLFLPVTDATANNSILEAMACGTPVISTAIGGIPDYVDNDSGWLLPVGDVAAHVNLLASLHDNRELARVRREPARARALKFDWGAVAKQMTDLYITLMA